MQVVDNEAYKFYSPMHLLKSQRMEIQIKARVTDAPVFLQGVLTPC